MQLEGISMLTTNIDVDSGHPCHTHLLMLNGCDRWPLLMIMFEILLWNGFMHLKKLIPGFNRFKHLIIKSWFRLSNAFSKSAKILIPVYI